MRPFKLSIYTYGLLVGILLCNSIAFSSAARKIECFVDKNQPKDDPNNVYKCNLDAKCCYEEGKSSCCTEKPTKTARWEQFQLWGTLALLILILAIVMFCCRHDGDFFCNRKDGGRYKYFCCGPIIYRDGKGPDPETLMKMKMQKKLQQQQDDDDSDYDEDSDEDLELRRKCQQAQVIDGPPSYEASEGFKDPSASKKAPKIYM